MMPDRDVDLMLRVRHGDDAAFEELVRRHTRTVLNVVYRYVGDPSLADDLAQETLVRALRDAHRYDDKWPLEVWLFRIARNLALDLLRREGRHRRHQDDAALCATPTPAAVTTAEHREFQVALEVALQELPETFRTVFLLRDGEGLSYEEIAEVLDISPKTVSSRLHRARQQLRELLREHLER